MPSFNACAEIIADNYKNPLTRQRAIILKGKPGSAKTSMGVAVAEMCDIPVENVHITHPARRNPINYMGLPDVAEDVMVWKEPEELVQLAEGKHVLVIDEVGQCTPIMQNTVGSMMLDRGINRSRFSDDVLVIATANNVEDRAGSKALLTHLANRAMVLQMEYTKDDFIPYGIDKGLDPLGLAYLEFRPGAIFDFDPQREINATARSWEYALNINTSLPPGHYMAALMGVLPEGTATEYLAFREIAERMPDPKLIEQNPGKAPIPEETDVLYATVSNLIINTTTVKAFENYMKFVLRLPTDFQTVYITHVNRRLSDINTSALYTRWLQDNYLNFGGGA